MTGTPAHEATIAGNSSRYCDHVLPRPAATRHPHLPGIGLSVSLFCGTGRSHDGFVPDREVHRAGDEALLMGFAMQPGRLLDHIRCGHSDLRPEHDLDEVAAAVGGLGH